MPTLWSARPSGCFTGGLSVRGYGVSIAKKSRDVLGTRFRSHRRASRLLVGGMPRWPVGGDASSSGGRPEMTVDGTAMVAREPSSGSDPDVVAQWSADRLALALEDVGFDVGREFPMLRGRVDGDGLPVVEMGRVTATVAAQLATVLSLVDGPHGKMP